MKKFLFSAFAILTGVASVLAGSSDLFTGPAVFASGSKLTADGNATLDTVARRFYLGAPLAAVTNRVVTSTNAIAGAYTIAGQPDVARVLTIAESQSGAFQVETATVSGSVGSSGAGNLSIVVTGAGITGSPLTIPVAVANSDTAAQQAAKIITALQANAPITALYTVGGSSATITLTRKTAAANDGTLNVAIGLGTATGPTAAPTSANTTAGVVGNTPGLLTITGTDIRGISLVETIVPVPGSTINSVNAFKTVTSIVNTGWVIGGANDTLVVGIGNLIGLPAKLPYTTGTALTTLGTTVSASAITGGTLASSTVDASSGTYDGTKKLVVYTGQ